VQISVLRELMRNLQAWESLYETDNIDVITGPDGATYHLFDVQYLYTCRDRLSPRQRQAIELCLYQNVKEKDATVIMGVSPTNPVAMYATNGLRRLCEMLADGELPRYRTDESDDTMAVAG
jgi:DNA-directed RNA polymerase specialized sigma24 family protein